LGTGNADSRSSGKCRAGVHCTSKNGARITISSKSPSKDLIIYGLEKAIRGNHDRARMTFIDFMYYWHERIFKQIKRKPR
jgi:hypothetical protein